VERSPSGGHPEAQYAPDARIFQEYHLAWTTRIES
jgi:hypothetical protein